MLGRSLAASILVSLAIDAVLPAQQFSSERHRMLPNESAPRAAAGDMDGDGDLDLVTPANGGLRITRNDGQGRFVPSTWIGAGSGGFALGDIDGDGDLDVAVAGVFAWIAYLPGKLFRNDGPLGFVDVSSQWPSTNEVPVRISFVDFDGDGDRDIVTCNRIIGVLRLGQPEPINRLYLNNGAGVFTDVTATRMPNTPDWNYGMATGDIDGDGDLDLVFAAGGYGTSWPARVRVFRQSAGGVAVEVSQLTLPVPWNSFMDVALTDHDLDGDLDIAAASTLDLRFFANAGNGTYSLATTVSEPTVVRLGTADFDGDGRIDLLALGEPMRMYRSTPAGFVDVTATHVEAAGLAPTDAVVFDAEGDGDPDVWANGHPQAMLWHNDGQGHLMQLAGDVLSTAQIIAAALGDMDGDGDLDLACIEKPYYSNYRVVVVRNDGFAPTNARQVLLPWSNYNPVRGIAWIDADVDGDLDLFVGTANQVGLGSTPQDRLFHNIGGTFVDVTSSQMPLNGTAERVAVGDIDGDGFPDLAVGSTVSAPRLYKANGTGGFTNVIGMLALPPAVGVPEMALLDFDSDGDLDIAVAMGGSWSGSAPCRLFRNDGPGMFVDVASSVGVPSVHALAVTAVDVDHDGYRDLLLGIKSGTPGTNGLVLLRALNGVFVDETSFRVPAMNSVEMIVPIDIDGDGWVDFGYRHAPDTPLQYLRNVDGVLSPMTNAVLGQLPALPAAADFDRDGDQDLIATFGLVRNRTRDLQNAVPPRLGMNAELVVHAYGGDGVNQQIVLLFLATSLASPPIPIPGLGTQYIDPATTVYHSTTFIAGTGGEATIAYTVPALPALLGSVVYAQAGFVHSPNPASWRLGNHVELRIRL